MARKVLTGCRDCRKCAASGVGRAGRGVGRLAAGLATAGLSEVGMATTRDCGQCGHALSLHQQDDVRGWAQGAGSPSKPQLEPAYGSALVDADPERTWEAIVGDLDPKTIRKRDNEARTVRYEPARRFGEPAIAVEATVLSDEIGTRIDWDVRPTKLGRFAVGDDATQIAKINARIEAAAQALTERVAQALDQPVGSAPTSPDASERGAQRSADPVDRLQQLAELRDRGVLTEEEFSAKKAQILDRM